MSNASQTLFQWQRSQKKQKPKADFASESGMSSWLTKLESRIDLESQTRHRPAAAAAAAGSQSEAAYFEAKQLLQEWSTKRDPLVEELLMEERNPGMREGVRRAWDCFEQQVASESALPDAFDTDLDRDLYTKLLEMDTADAGKHVASELLKKPIITAEELDRLKRGDGPTERDRDRFAAQRVKMDMRHAKVREMRLQREAERNKKLEERRHCQEVRERAHELVVAEERERTERARREEQLIRSEMSKIRAQIASTTSREPRQNAKDTTPKLKRPVSERKVVSTGPHDGADEKVPQAESESVTLLSKPSTNATESNLRARQQAAEAELRRKMAEVRLVRRCFAAWFNETLESRLKLAKITAIADFKLKRRCFGALRDAVRTRRVERELKEARRLALQQAAAERHFRAQTLRKCFFALRRYANQRISDKLAQQIEAERRRRVDNFLQHLTLQQPPSDQKPITKDTSDAETLFRSSQSGDERVADEKVQPNAKTKTKQEETRSRRIMEPWQVTKAILRDPAPSQDRSASAAANCQPSSVVKTLESRQRNYQRVLSEQTRLIKEQKRLIEDLRSEQRAANIQAQLEREKLEADLHNKFSQLQLASVKPANATATATSDPRSVNSVESRFALRPSQPHSPPSGTRRAANEKSETEEDGESNRTLLKQGTKDKMDDFARRMQERAVERQRQRAEREERRRQIEEQRALSRQLEAAERERAEQEEKAQRAAEARERARVAKQQQQARIDAQTHAAELNRRADEHRLRSLIKGAFTRWRRHVFVSVPNRLDIFRTFYQHKVLRRTLTAWHTVVESESLANCQKAHALHHRLVTRRCLRAWRRSRFLIEEQERVAESHHATRLCRTAFDAWLRFTVQLQSQEFRNLRIASQHYDARLLKKAFQCWTRLPAIEKDERLREARLSEMRRKVLEVLPDFSKP